MSDLRNRLDWLTAAAIQGRMFHTAVGSLVLPVAGRATILPLQPELVIDVPTGKTIIPVEIAITVEVAAGTLNEARAVSSTAVRGAGTSTAGTAICTRTDRVRATGCSIYYTYSADAAALAGEIEFWRVGYPFAYATAGPVLKFVYSVQQSTPQVVVGPGSVSIHFGSGAGAAPTGFITATWVELPTTDVI